MAVGSGRTGHEDSFAFEGGGGADEVVEEAVEGGVVSVWFDAGAVRSCVRLSSGERNKAGGREKVWGREGRRGRKDILM